MTESERPHGERKLPVLRSTVAPAHVVGEIKRTEIKPETATAVVSYQPLFLAIMAVSVIFAFALEIVAGAVLPAAWQSFMIVPLIAGFGIAFLSLTALFRPMIRFPAHECQWILNQNNSMQSKARLRTEGEMAPLYLELAEPFLPSPGVPEVSRLAICDDGRWRRTPTVFSGSVPQTTQYQVGQLSGMKAIAKVYQDGVGPWVDVTIYIDPRSGKPHVVKSPDGLMLVKK